MNFESKLKIFQEHFVKSSIGIIKNYQAIIVGEARPISSAVPGTKNYIFSIVPMMQMVTGIYIFVARILYERHEYHSAIKINRIIDKTPLEDLELMLKGAILETAIHFEKALDELNESTTIIGFAYAAQKRLFNYLLNDRDGNMIALNKDTIYQAILKGERDKSIAQDIYFSRGPQIPTQYFKLLNPGILLSYSAISGKKNFVEYLKKNHGLTNGMKVICRGARGEIDQVKMLGLKFSNEIIGEVDLHCSFEDNAAVALMCQHFSGQLVTQIFVFLHIPLVINNHSQNEF